MVGGWPKEMCLQAAEENRLERLGRRQLTIDIRVVTVMRQNVDDVEPPSPPAG